MKRVEEGRGPADLVLEGVGEHARVGEGVVEGRKEGEERGFRGGTLRGGGVRWGGQGRERRRLSVRVGMWVGGRGRGASTGGRGGESVGGSRVEGLLLLLLLLLVGGRMEGVGGGGELRVICRLRVWWWCADRVGMGVVVLLVLIAIRLAALLIPESLHRLRHGWVGVPSRRGRRRSVDLLLLPRSSVALRDLRAHGGEGDGHPPPRVLRTPILAFPSKVRASSGHATAPDARPGEDAGRDSRGHPRRRGRLHRSALQAGLHSTGMGWTVRRGDDGEVLLRDVPSSLRKAAAGVPVRCGGGGGARTPCELFEGIAESIHPAGG